MWKFLITFVPFTVSAAIAYGHPAGLLDISTTRCGKNKLVSEVKEICIGNVFTGDHSGATELSPVVVLRFKEGSSRIFPVISKDQSRLQLLDGSFSQEGVIQIARIRAVSVETQDGIIRRATSAPADEDIQFDIEL